MGHLFSARLEWDKINFSLVNLRDRPDYSYINVEKKKKQAFFFMSL